VVPGVDIAIRVPAGTEPQILAAHTGDVIQWPLLNGAPVGDQRLLILILGELGRLLQRKH